MLLAKVLVIALFVMASSARKGPRSRPSFPQGHSTIATLPPVAEEDEEDGSGDQGGNETTTSGTPATSTTPALYDVWGDEIAEKDEAESEGEQFSSHLPKLLFSNSRHEN